MTERHRKQLFGCALSVSVAWFALSACSSYQSPGPGAAPTPTMGTRFVPPPAHTTTEGWYSAQLLAEHSEKMFPDVNDWAPNNQQIQWQTCGSDASRASVWFIIDGHTKEAPRELMNHVAQDGPSMGFYSNSQPVGNGNGLQLFDPRPDGYQLVVDFYNPNRVEIFVRTPCLEWNGSPGG